MKLLKLSLLSLCLLLTSLHFSCGLSERECGECKSFCSDYSFVKNGKWTGCYMRHFCPTEEPDVRLCTNLKADPNNCGKCGNVCAKGLLCLQGSCQKKRKIKGEGHYETLEECQKECAISENVKCCPMNDTDFKYACADLQTDVKHCGKCSNSCQFESGLLIMNGIDHLSCFSGTCACPEYSHQHVKLSSVPGGPRCLPPKSPSYCRKCNECPSP
mgnify:CR=1 FL=1